jgi:hypothetical protein
MSDRRNRELVLSRLRELPTAYEALEHQVARGGSVQVPSRGEPPIPIPTAVLDLMTDFETQILRLHSRALVVLGWHLPPVKLAREGQYIACWSRAAALQRVTLRDLLAEQDADLSRAYRRLAR